MFETVKKLIREVFDYKKDILHRIRINKRVTKLFGCQYRVNRKFINIITTYKCNLLCYDCSQNCRQAPSGEKMTAGQVNRFVRESIKNNIHYQTIFITGGESLIEKNIFEIFNILIKYKNKYSLNTKIILITNGYGKLIKEQIKKVPSTIIIRNTNKTSNYSSRFFSINIAPKDFKEYKDVDFRNGCYILQGCGMSLTKYGYYACPNMGAIDRVVGLNIGRKTFLKSNDKMRDQMNKLCRYCGLFLYKGYKGNDRNKQSKTYKKLFKKYKLKKPNLTDY